MANDYNRISEAAYSATMRRHGTSDWTAEDARIEREWHTQNDKPAEVSVDDEEVEPSPGNSSSTSDSKPETSSESLLDSDLSPVLTTESPSVKDQTATSSVSRTAGTKSNTAGKALK